MLDRFIARLSVAALVVSGAAVLAGPAPLSAAEVSAALIRALPQSTCPAGTTPLTPVTAKVSAHGADVYHYAMSSGPGFDAYVPPAGFQPLQADNATLAEMNLPTRPTNHADLAAWSTQMAGYRGTEAPAYCRGAEHLSTPAGEAATTGSSATHYGNDHWSGYVDTQGSYTEVAAHWTQTSAHTCNCVGPTDEVTWVGIGGWSSGDLIQDGTRNYSNTQPYAWFEYLGASSTVDIIKKDPTNVGDDIAAAVKYFGLGRATFGVTDNGVYKVNAVQTGIAGDYDGSTAEWINERPVPDKGPLPTLTNYIRTNWSSARAVRNDTTVVDAGAGAPFAVVMSSDGSTQAPPCSSSSKIMAYPENLSGANFDSIWCRAS